MPGDARLVDCEVLPEKGVSAAQAEALMGASRYLYSEVWDQFCDAFGIEDLTKLLAKECRRK